MMTMGRPSMSGFNQQALAVPGMAGEDPMNTSQASIGSHYQIGSQVLPDEKKGRRHKSGRSKTNLRPSLSPTKAPEFPTASKGKKKDAKNKE